MTRTRFLRRGADYFGMSGPGEFFAATVLLLVLVLLLIVDVLHHKFDSDEPQHLHVVWGWAHGLVQYRDLSDNHMPLFHIAMAPFFALLGERATILYWMRFILLPTFLVSAWCTYRIGERLFSRRCGIWSVVLLGVFAPYHLSALEFRTDNLWTALWLLNLVVLLEGDFNPRRALIAGFLMGLCFGVSMKSTLFLIALVGAAIVTLILAHRKKFPSFLILGVRAGSFFLLGTILVPAIIAISFASFGVWHDFRYHIFDFNLLALQVLEKQSPWPSIVAFPIVVAVGYQLLRKSQDPALGFRRAFIAILFGVYFLFLQLFWHIVTLQDYLPMYPLATVLIAAGVIVLSDFVFQHRLLRFRVFPLPAVVAVVECVVLIVLQPLWQDGTREETSLLRDILALTNRSDYVFDAKGETVFRSRTLHIVLEKINEFAIRRRLLPDDTAERCIATRTCVIATTMQVRFPPATREFIERNYLPVRPDLRVAGVFLKAAPADPNRAEFEITIPAIYKLISRNGNVTGFLDNVPYNAAQFLEAGPHTFISNAPIHGVAVLWAQAVDREFTPFNDL